MRRVRQQGVAFLIVLWVLALLAIVLGAFALQARTENLQARHLFDGTRALYAAEAGLNRAVAELMQPDPTLRWLPDGRLYQVEFEGAGLEIRITDESGKIDLNGADPQTLDLFFQSLGVDPLESARIADAIVDWRDPDDLLSPNGAEDPEYEAAGLPYGAKDALFDTVSELQQVLGVDYELFRQAEPGLTVLTGHGRPNPAFAPLEALRALPGMTDELARQIIEQRQAWDPTTGGPPPLLPDGTPLVVQGGTGTYSIESRATLQNGAWTRLYATIRIGGAGASGLAYTVLRWEDGEPL
ncbi:MAG TPA: type II secretion system minor pseudopilin GspK [Xanthomonadaceae bacterium]|nr:type II secretion system minor pseudopilin GspK [Xanthomonadaceae bacterium]